MKIYLVGGAVRDKLLNYPYEEKDWVVVGATPEQLLEEGFQQVGKDFPVFLHPNTKEEYALARTERKIAAGYTGFECFSSPDVTLEEDLERRDLTINAIAEDSDGFLTDPYGGQQDLKDKVLRHVSVAFAEDPLRVLRVARFSARYHHLGFTLATETLELMRSISSSDELLALPAERVWKELQRSLIEKSPQQFFITLQEAEALEKLMPELSPLQNKSIEIIKQAAALKNSAPVIFALLMFQCQNDDKDNAKTLCQRLKCPNDFKELALMISNFGKQCHSSKDSADTLLTLLEQLDPFRRPERFELFLQCCELYFNDKQCSSQLRQALSLCSDINIAQLVEEGLSGKEIGQALRQRRLEAIQRGIF